MTAPSRSGRPSVTAACSQAPSRFQQNHCNDGDAVTVTGTDISVEYADFRDDSGSVITVSASAGIRSSTGSVSLDRTVYPVPIGDNPDTDTDFPTHGDKSLGKHDLTVYVSVEDSRCRHVSQRNRFHSRLYGDDGDNPWIPGDSR